MRGNERNEEKLKIPINENCADERIPRNVELPPVKEDTGCAGCLTEGRHVNYYLIDLENVQSKGLMGADLLGTDDCMIIFYSPCVKSVTELAKERILRGGSAVVSRCVNVRTKDALDFELSLYAGMIVSSRNPDLVFIISEDGGYKATLEAGNREMRLLGAKGKTFFQCRSILEAWYQKELSWTFNGQDKPFPVKYLDKIKRAECTGEDVAKRHGVNSGRLTTLIDLSGNDMCALYRALLHEFGRRKGLEIYRDIKTEGILTAHDTDGRT